MRCHSHEVIHIATRRTHISITPIDKVLYTAKAHTTGGREGGDSRTSDGRLEVKLSVPGTPGTGTNPEQLFAVGWSACFLSAVKLVAGKMKVKLPAEVAIDPEVTWVWRTAVIFCRLALTSFCLVSSPKLRRGLWTARTKSVRILKPHAAHINVQINVKTETVAHI